jgi:ankyrin repeat protein
VLPVVRQRTGRASTFGYVEIFISKPGDPGFSRKIKAYAGSGLEIVTGLEPGRYEISRYQFRYKNDGGYGSSRRIGEPFLLEAGTLTVSPITILVSEYRKYPGADTVWMSVRWAPVMQQQRAEIAQRLDQLENSSRWSVRFESEEAAANSDPYARSESEPADAFDRLTRELWKAAATNRDGAVERVRHLVNRGADINATQSDGRTALMLAAEHSRDAELIRTLVRLGSQTEARLDSGHTALMIAAANNEDPTITAALLQMGADPNAVLPNGWTALILAGRYSRNHEILRELVRGGAELDARDELGRTALMVVASENHESPNDELVRTLLEAGADPTATVPGGDSVLTAAARSTRDPQVVRLLVAAGADVNAQNERGGSPFLVAAEHNRSRRVLAMLTELGADPEAHLGDGRTALMLAAAQGNLSSIRFLLDRGVPVDARDTQGETALMIAARTTTVTQAIRALVDGGADVNARRSDGMTALMLCARDTSSTRMLRVLLEVGADPTIRDADGNTAWFYLGQNDIIVGSKTEAALRDAAQ